MARKRKPRDEPDENHPGNPEPKLVRTLSDLQATEDYAWSARRQRKGESDVEAAIQDARLALNCLPSLMRANITEYGPEWEFRGVVDLLVSILESGVADDMLHAQAEDILDQHNKCLPNPNDAKVVEVSAEMVDELRNSIVAVLRQARPPAAARPGRRPGRSTRLYVRDNLIAAAVDKVCRQYGFKPTRNSATGHFESGCSIVKTALEQSGMHLAESQINDIYTDCSRSD